MSLREQFFAFDDRLAAHGVKPLTAWWRAGVGEWLDAYEQRHVLELWACVGRGAAKSTALYKLALFFTLFGSFVVPPGETHYAVVLSRMKVEAAKGLAIIGRWLALLGVDYRSAGDELEIVELRRGIRVVAASVAATSGWRAYFVGRDERSKWSEDGVENFDAVEVDVSAMSMTASHEFAPTVTFGSAWTKGGEFYDAIIGGTTETRVVLGPAPTWVAAPHITEESARRKESRPRYFDREYACIFASASAAAFEPDEVSRAFRDRKLERVSRYVLCLDPSRLRHDRYTACLVCWAIEPASEVEYAHEMVYDAERGREIKRLVRDRFDQLQTLPRVAASEPILCFVGVESVDPSGAPSADLIASHFATKAKRVGADTAISDQFEAFATASLYRSRGMRFLHYDHTGPSREAALGHIQRLCREDRIWIDPESPEAAETKIDLLSVEERLTSAGGVTFSSRRDRAGHGDRFSLIVTAAHHSLSGVMDGAPHAIRRGGVRVGHRAIGNL